MKLNSGQEKAVNLMVDGFLNGKISGLTLLGEGGTGKTTCVMAAVEKWVEAGLTVLLTAPTNKAVKQLETAARNWGVNDETVVFMTIHKAMGLALLPNDQTKYIAPVGPNILGNFDVVVLDEGSMMPARALFYHMLPAIEASSTRTVIMGDKMQLPPVKESYAKALELSQFACVELTEVERFEKGSGIAQITSNLRNRLVKGERFKFDAEEYDLKVVKPALFEKEVLSRYDKDTDLDKIRTLAWTNARVNALNNGVREKIYGKNAARFEVGERVSTGTPVFSEMELLLSTGEECIVTDVQLSSILDDQTGDEYNTYLLTLEPLHAEATSVYCHTIHESSEMELRERLQEIAGRANKTGDKSYWAKFHALNDLFTVIKYCYCMTVHGSQGSTYETVLVDTNNILRNNRSNERNKLLYVAFSRASKELVTSKEKFIS